MEDKLLVAKWYEACMGYLYLFCEKHGLNYNEAKWKDNNAGTSALFSFEDGSSIEVSMDTIRYDIDKRLDEEMFKNWLIVCKSWELLGFERKITYREMCERNAFDNEKKKVEDVIQGLNELKKYLKSK